MRSYKKGKNLLLENGLNVWSVSGILNYDHHQKNFFGPIVQW